MTPLDRRLFISLAGSLLAVRFPAPSARADTKPKLRIAFANFDDEAAFGALVLRGMQAAAKNHPDLDVLFYDNKKDGARVMEIARTVAIVKPDVFIEYNSIVPQANIQVARIMKAAGIPVLSLQISVPGTPLFAVDNALSGYESGKAIALAAKKKWPGEVPRVLIIGLPESGGMFIERAENAQKAIRQVFPDASMDLQSSKEQPSVARQVTADFLTKNPGRKIVIWTHVDAMGLAALTAARNSGRDGDIVIGSTGGDLAALPEIRRENSPYIGTFSFFPALWGDDLLSLATRMAQGEKIPEIVHPSRQLFIDASNVDQFYPR